MSSREGADKPLIAAARCRGRKTSRPDGSVDPDLLPHPEERRPSFPADRLQGLDDRLLPGRGEADSPLLDDPPLFAGDLLQGIAEILPVFEGDVGDDRNEGDNHIGGVEPAPHADLQNGDIHPLPLKMEKGHRRQEFKIAHLLP